MLFSKVGVWSYSTFTRRIFAPSESVPADISNYVQSLTKPMNDLKITLPRLQQRRVSLPQQLYNNIQVFITRHNVQPPLPMIYDGPLKVITMT